MFLINLGLDIPISIIYLNFLIGVSYNYDFIQIINYYVNLIPNTSNMIDFVNFIQIFLSFNIIVQIHNY